MARQEGQVVTMRREQLRSVVETYFHALASKDFSAIPYDDDVVLRAPLCPGGANKPLVGKDALHTIWWPPLEPALGEVKLHDIYINEQLTGACGFAEVSIANTKVVLRVCDRFAVNAAGKIIEQENHFDPRDVTNPGWEG